MAKTLSRPVSDSNRRIKLGIRHAHDRPDEPRAKGATQPEIMEATGWQAHTVRGFVSILGGTGGEEVESSKSTTGERTYKIAK